IADSIPVERSEAKGNSKNVVILTRDESYRKDPNGAIKLIRRLYRKYPRLVSQMESRHIRYNQTLDYISKGEEEGRIFVIRPSREVTVGRIEKNKEKLLDLYEQGYQDGEASYQGLKTFLGLL
nr:patatin family protein [Lachnospiraceae bacterium]